MKLKLMCTASTYMKDYDICTWDEAGERCIHLHSVILFIGTNRQLNMASTRDLQLILGPVDCHTLYLI